MDHPFFTFADFDSEIVRKLDSLDVAPERLMRGWLDRLRGRGLTATDGDRLEELFRRLSVLPFDHMHRGYLTHPIRVAAAYIDRLERFDYPSAAVGLCHNLVEAGFADHPALAGPFLPDDVRADIARLTIDRQRERDSAYLASFYDGLAGGPRDLLLLKAFDKIDNVLWWPRLDVGPHDVTVVLKFTCPHVSTTAPDVSDYLDRLARYGISDEAHKRHASDPVPKDSREKTPS